MNTLDLEKAFRAELIRLLGASPLIIKGNQDISQGRVDAGVYFWPVSDNFYGWQQRRYINITGKMWDKKEYRMVESQYQISSIGKTAEDDIKRVAMAAQTLDFVERLQKNYRIGVQRVTQILKPVFVNDRGQYEYNPNFTITFTHVDEFESAVGSVDCKDVRLIGV